MRLQVTFVTNLLAAVLSLASTTAGVVYYVKPTEPCAHYNSSCPSNETCHSMDHYASNSSHYFSPDNINVTLYFMCGVHNCTKHLDVHDLQTFTMIGTAGRKHVTINMPIPTTVMNYSQSFGNSTYTFANISNMKIENATIYFISFSFVGENCVFAAEHTDFYGRIGFTSPMLSVINITRSQAELRDCTFQGNVFVRIRSSAVLTVSSCIFSSYNDAAYSAIAVDNSTITLTGTVSFINNTISWCGGAFSVNSGYALYKQVPISVLKITGALVRFINNTSNLCGGALYLKCTEIIVTNATVILKDNEVRNTNFLYGGNGGGGAMFLEDSNLVVKNATMHLINNSAYGATYGGAMFQINSSVYINDYAKLSFVGNVALFQGGAMYHYTYSPIHIDGHSSLVFYNNSARQGGALYLNPHYSETGGSIRVGNDSHVEFSYNTATKYGGAVYVNDQTCLFDFKSYSSTVLFRENSASEGVGMHIYGVSVKSTHCMLSYCDKDIVQYMPNITNSFSPVSSSPKRVCLCDTKGKPQCANFSSIYNNRYKVYRGELFSISVVVVGDDFGATTGTINTAFIGTTSTGYGEAAALHSGQYHQWISNSTQCSNITYNLYSSTTSTYTATLILHPFETVTGMYDVLPFISDSIKAYIYRKRRCIDSVLLKSPVFLNISLLAGCPPGFTLTLQGQFYGCRCYPTLQINNFDCYITNNAGYLKWNSTMWVNAVFNGSESDGIILAHYCPLSYCKSNEKIINLGRDPNAQCDFKHAGVLCGGCANNYSLAIGSSRCIMCSSDVHLLLLLFFLAAGVLLVVFILVLNLTVAQGLINGLIFYANLLWTYKDIFFPSEKQTIMQILQIFIAWLNLDFGIETCFVIGLTAFWKTWLQFLFPLYIWFIAGTIIIACHYSSRLTNLIGDRAVPLLATLFLLSYTKLNRTLTTIFRFGVLTHFPHGSKTIVWYTDGSLPYC